MNGKIIINKILVMFILLLLDHDGYNGLLCWATSNHSKRTLDHVFFENFNILCL